MMLACPPLWCAGTISQLRLMKFHQKPFGLGLCNEPFDAAWLFVFDWHKALARVQFCKSSCVPIVRAIVWSKSNSSTGPSGNPWSGPSVRWGTDDNGDEDSTPVGLKLYIYWEAKEHHSEKRKYNWFNRTMKIRLLIRCTLDKHPNKNFLKKEPDPIMWRIKILVQGHQGNQNTRPRTSLR